MITSSRVRMCFVCLGNICRSPTAEGIMLHLINEAGLSDRIAVDSAGTSAYHIGENADERSIAAALSHGVVINQEARQFSHRDFQDADYILAMDQSNKRAILSLATTPHDAEKVHLLREFDPQCKGQLDVPDPYYGGGNGFETVFQICYRSCVELLNHVRQKHGL